MREVLLGTVGRAETPRPLLGVAGFGEVRVVVLVVAEALVQKAAARVLSGAFQTIDPILSMAPVWLR
ncbi:hypothetical protein GCM10027613_10640 [Microlunatus endophyticus]